MESLKSHWEQQLKVKELQEKEGNDERDIQKMVRKSPTIKSG